MLDLEAEAEAETYVTVRTRYAKTCATTSHGTRGDKRDRPMRRDKKHTARRIAPRLDVGAKGVQRARPRGIPASRSSAPKAGF
jgi:hypothetical protein